MGRSGNFIAQQHIEEAERLSKELGGTDSDVKAYFFGLKDEALAAVLDEYERKYGKDKRRYAEQTLPDWRNGQRKMSGRVAERLFDLLPPLMPLDTKFDMVRALWQTYSPRSHGCFVIGPDCDPLVASTEIERQLLREVTEYRIPDPLAKRFKWLSSGDVEVSQQLLNHFLSEERALIVSDARSRTQIILSHVNSGGRWTDRIRQEYRIGNHRLELFFDPRATGILKGNPGELPQFKGAKPKESPKPNSDPLIVAVALVFVTVAALLTVQRCVTRNPEAPDRAAGSTSPIGSVPSFTPPDSEVATNLQAPQTLEVVPRIREERDLSLPGHSRRALKIVLGTRKADAATLRAVLVEVAKKQEADTVLAYGYLEGEDIQTAFPAAILEYGKSGKGWGPDSVLPPDGVFEVREARHEAMNQAGVMTAPSVPSLNIEPTAGRFLAGDQPREAAERENDDAARRLIGEWLHVFEPKTGTMTELDQAKLTLKSLAASLGISEADVMRLPSAERRRAMIRHISLKYGVSESDLLRVWLTHFGTDQQRDLTDKTRLGAANTGGR